MQENRPEWMNDPELSDFPKEKLMFLNELFVKMPKHSPNDKITPLQFKKEMLPFLLSVSKLSKEHNISFCKEEISLIYKVLQKYSTCDDVEKMQRIFSYNHFL